MPTFHDPPPRTPPTLVVYLTLQRQFVSGFRLGASKG
jgi:ABC-type maltose transport system permease subunit